MASITEAEDPLLINVVSLAADPVLLQQAVLNQAGSAETAQRPVPSPANERIAPPPPLWPGMAGFNNQRGFNMNTPGGSQAGRSYAISFNRPVQEPVRIAVEPLPGNADYQTIKSTTGVNVGGRQNPVTGQIETRVTNSGTYVVVENRQDFNDIQHRSRDAAGYTPIGVGWHP
jgi:hypothetical protein